MTAATSGNPPTTLSRLWRRELDHYPGRGARNWQLSIVVAVTIVLYWQAYAYGSVSVLILEELQMSLFFYTYIFVGSAAAGAAFALLGGICDRIGRANFVVVGLLVATLVSLLAIPFATDKTTFTLWVIVHGALDGMIFVATPSLVRDFSPQLGRATAMGFWTIGPVGGSLLVTFVAGQTLPVLGSWQSQYIISGIAGMIVFVVALFTLRDLSPRLRDQLVVSAKDRAIVEARARGMDLGQVQRHQHRPFRQMLKLDLLGSAIAVSVFLLIYFAAIGYFVIYLSQVFGFSASEANSLQSFYWGCDIVALIVAGLLSDRLKVRKPFMLAGGVGTVAMTLVLIAKSGEPAGYWEMALILSVLSASLGVAFAPWMASYTENVERHNPALVATGIALWSSIIRWVVMLQGLLIVHVIGSPSTAGGWQNWFWVCVAGQVLFIAMIWSIAGYWSPRRGREAVEAHEKAVEAELAVLARGDHPTR